MSADERVRQIQRRHSRLIGCAHKHVECDCDRDYCAACLENWPCDPAYISEWAQSAITSRDRRIAELENERDVWRTRYHGMEGR